VFFDCLGASPEWFLVNYEVEGWEKYLGNELGTPVHQIV
jgi:hypothetical protein